MFKIIAIYSKRSFGFRYASLFVLIFGGFLVFFLFFFSFLLYWFIYLNFILLADVNEIWMTRRFYAALGNVTQIQLAKPTE